MAGSSPRRSIRARNSQTATSASHHSSASSNSSSRADRNTRTANKTESPRKSTPSASLSSEPPDDVAMVEDASQTRRRKRGQGAEQDKLLKEESTDMMNGNGEIVEDDEAVRCICGHDEYPGPPPLEEDSKKGIKDSSEIEFITEADYTEDLAGFFLQCDMCKVWQHGGCVGIKNEDMSPEEYFCEQCRKDLHKIFTAPNGQKYSHYLPLYHTLSRTTSRAASFSKDGTRSPRGSKSGRPSSSLQSAKRRSTMNSRDAAYDEEEQLRRAIEASKGEKSGESMDGSIRRNKRGRSDSEEKQEASKRQRTASGSPSPSNELARFASQNDSDDGANVRNGGTKRIRGAAARNHKEKELREEKERQRVEAANKRKGRADRRRVDDSDPSDETPAPGRASAKDSQPADPPPLSQGGPPDTSPVTQSQPNSHKKGGRPPHGRKGKLGKNQYTRDRDQLDGDERSPGRSQSRDVGKCDENGQAPSTRTNSDSKPSKAKAASGNKITMVDMKRKVAAMLDFISRTQLEMVGESLTPSHAESTQNLMKGLAGSIIPLLKNSEENKEENREDKGGGEGVEEKKEPEKDFNDLTLLEMMDHLTGQLVKWQNQFV